MPYSGAVQVILASSHTIPSRCIRPRATWGPLPAQTDSRDHTASKESGSTPPKSSKSCLPPSHKWPTMPRSLEALTSLLMASAPTFPSRCYFPH
ncbi:hypothetical protein FOMG_19985 [Fusarium oxysporum f. sp. melonis 26406]|uniref:Uncharacterized protein n=1 Tax=Fusarium oxysporum f. sp. melonis 26406 TaxID=1089452 RepID=W9YVN0_FUSOX|nr:hypothetical protein FOMG_19985 [Fusarium oxysporum f. sp. melonis 26406]